MAGMTNRRRIERLLRSRLRSAGRQFEEARQAYRSARVAAQAGLPTDDDGRARIVCRRYTERRAVALDDELHPECYDPGHRDCRGCHEDVRDGRVETW
jgi:type II secretory pathway pseudopilin PulG